MEGGSASCYFGALSPLFCQPGLAEFIGSSTSLFPTCWHLGHSKVRRSEPLGRGSIRASIMRPWHFGQRSRSIGSRDGSVEWAKRMRCSFGSDGSVQHSQSPMLAEGRGLKAEPKSNYVR